MVSLAKKFINYLLAKDKHREKVYPIDEELIERDKIVNEMSKKLQAYDAQLSKISAEENLKKIYQSDKDKQKDKIIELQEQKNDMLNKRYSNVVSLKKILCSLDLRKKKGSIDITDRNGNVILGKFKDLVILNNGMMGLKDSKDKILSMGYNIRQVIQKPESLFNQISRGIISIPCNEDYIFIPDIEEIKVPECTYDISSGKIKWAQVREKPIKQMIIEREELIRDKNLYIEKLEQDNIDLNRKNNDLKRSLTVYKKRSEASETDLSKALDKSLQFENRIGELQTRIINLQEANILNERLVSGLKQVNQELLDKAEEMGVKTEFRKALDMIQSTLSWAKTITPKETIIREESNQQNKPNEIN